jgi:hypothetical protein
MYLLLLVLHLSTYYSDDSLSRLPITPFLVTVSGLFAGAVLVSLSHCPNSARKAGEGHFASLLRASGEQQAT